MHHCFMLVFNWLNARIKTKWASKSFKGGRLFFGRVEAFSRYDFHQRKDDLYYFANQQVTKVHIFFIPFPLRNRG